MGDVFLALQEGIGGFEKLVVVKRINPELTQDQSFVDMFLNEARLVAAIRHQNVVEILDIQRDSNGLFIVLEYLSGETIYYIMKSLSDRGETVPYPIACRLVADFAEGLHAAHSTTDNNGDLLGIVHRDVTPSNLIVGFNGVPKILDFGVAAGSAQRAGSGGAAVGKVGYQAPEQIAGLDEDERTDVFQLAICLHELLTGKPLFASDDEHEAMLNVVERPIPKPSTRNPDVPAELDEIVMNALALDWDARTKTAEQFGASLEALLEATDDHVTQKRVSEWMRDRFVERYEERIQLERDIVSELRGEVVDPAELPEMFAEVSSAGRRAAPSAATRVAVPAGLARRRKKKKPVGKWVAAGVLAVGMSAGAVYLATRGASEPEEKRAAVVQEVDAGAVKPTVTTAMPDAAAKPKPIMLALNVEPATAEIVIDGVMVGTGRFSGTIPRDGSTHALTLSAPGYQPRTIKFRDTAPPESITLEPSPPAKDVTGATSTTPPRVVRRTPKRPKTPVNPDTKKTLATKQPDGKQTTPTATTNGKPQVDPKKVDPWQNKKKTDNKDPWK